MNAKHGRLRRDVQLGATVGVVTASLFAAWALLMYLFVGSDSAEASTPSLSAIVAAYYFAGVVGGGVVGSLMPMTRTLIGTVIVSSMASIILFFSVQMTIAGPVWHWDHRTWVQTTLLGLVFGVVLGPFIARSGRAS